MKQNLALVALFLLPIYKHIYIYILFFNSYTVRDFRNLCHMVGFPIYVRDLPENEAKFLHFKENFDLWLEMSFWQNSKA